MAYPLDIAAQNAALDALYGDNHGATMPASFELALYDAHPLLGGVEVTYPGFTRPVVANTSANFPAASGGVKRAAAIPLPDPTGAATDTATHVLFIDAADHTTRYAPGKLAQELAIDGTETNIAAAPAISWNTEGL